MSQFRYIVPLATELKFLVDPTIAHRIRDWARTHLAADPNGAGPFADEYRTTSLYFDTAQFDVFHRRGSFGRAKYRIRRYGEDDMVFLERKMKTNGYLFKRRTRVPIGALEHLVAGVVAGGAGWEGDWFQRRLAARHLQPIAEITYLRTARVGEQGVRLTVDEMVQAREIEGISFAMQPELTTIPDRCVVEMKFVRTPPALLKRMVEDFALTPQAVSKYRASVEALGLANAHA